MSHYFSEKQDSTLVIKEIYFSIAGQEIKFLTAPGVFSKDKVDKGSELLITRCQASGRVLDMGCGYGAVGICLKLMYPLLDVVMCDINERAVYLAKKNAQLNNAVVDILKSNIFDKIKGKFDVILCNPPQTAGREICYKIIEGAAMHLKSGGMLQLVARHKKGGKMLSEKMQDVFGNCEVIARGSGYRIYCSTV